MDAELLHHLDSAETLVLGQTQSLASLPSLDDVDGEPVDDDELELEAARAAAAKYQELLQKRQQKLAAKKAEADRAALLAGQKAEAERAALLAVQKAEAERAALQAAQKAEADRAALEQQQKAEADRAALEQQQKAQAEKAALEQAQKAEADRAALEQQQKAEADRAALQAAQKAQAEKAALEQAQKAEADRAALQAAQKAQAEKAALEQAQKAEADRAAQLALLDQTEQMLQQAPADAANRAAKEAQLELDLEAEQQLRTQATEAALQADQYRETAQRLAREAEQARQVFLEASKKAEAAVKARVDKTLEVEQAQQQAATRAGKTVHVDSTAQQAQPEHQNVTPVRNGLALEAVLRFRRQQEEEQKDEGDWKWRVEWLRQVRYYNNKQIAGPAAGLCPRCLCTRDTWLDVHERFNAPADLATARLTAVGDIALKSLPGWEPEMEVPDLLHVLWTGTGRDLIGSLCLQIVETSASYTGSTYDERLRQLRRDMQAWCSAHGIRPSTVEELSMVLGARYPPIDSGGAKTGRLYIQCYIKLAEEALQASRALQLG
eukprot:s54_g21.t1